MIQGFKILISNIVKYPVRIGHGGSLILVLNRAHMRFDMWAESESARR